MKTLRFYLSPLSCVTLASSSTRALLYHGFQPHWPACLVSPRFTWRPCPLPCTDCWLHKSNPFTSEADAAPSQRAWRMFLLISACLSSAGFLCLQRPPLTCPTLSLFPLSLFPLLPSIFLCSGRGKVYLGDYFGCVCLPAKLHAVPQANQEKSSSIVYSRSLKEDRLCLIPYHQFCFCGCSRRNWVHLVLLKERCLSQTGDGIGCGVRFDIPRVTWLPSPCFLAGTELGVEGLCL